MSEKITTSSPPPARESAGGGTRDRPAGRDRPDGRGARREGEEHRPAPWRTEGLPHSPAASPPSGGGTGGGWRRWRFLVVAVVGYGLLFALITAQDASGGATTVSYTEFVAQVRAGNVEDVYSRGETIQADLKKAAPVPAQPGEKAPKGKTYTELTTQRPTFARDDLLAQLESKDVVVRATPVVQQRGALTNLLFSLLPFVLILLVVSLLLRRLRRSGGGGLGGGLGGLLGGGAPRKPVDPQTSRTTFADVAGIDEVEHEVGEIVDFLRHPDKYAALGARIPHGVLLEGAPGTGKTLLARATAGEAGVPFFTASAAEFIEMIVGVGARRVRELFSEARKVAPAIVFIDEIDTIGRSRSGSNVAGGNDEREQTLNQVLTEMDGFSPGEGVVVIAATNRADVLDSALTRPGRFDRTITVNAPDRTGRAAILAVHTRGVPLDAGVDLEQVARETPGMTGADLANLVNEAALAAARAGRTTVDQHGLEEALEKIQLGATRAVVMAPDERERTAHHEGGHALMGLVQHGADPVRRVSIVPRGRALGVTLSTPADDRYGYDADYLRGRIVGALGGMAAEQVVYGVVTTGAESDLAQATGIARSMVGRWGMSEAVGPVAVLPPDGSGAAPAASTALLDRVDAEVRALVERCYATAQELVLAHRDALENIARELLAHESLDEAEVLAAAGLPARAVADTASLTPPSPPGAQQHL